jgi:alkanesulfonate monooxygenase SsuD/methylene tetrahydromethanopterin reductase-like flavin-dependent oxidoreductase (luciferase family)
MSKMALTFYSLLDISIDDMVECFQAAERSGFDYGFMSESAGRDAPVILTQVAHETTTLKLGTNILPIYTRSPWLTATAALTVNEAAAGRFEILGLGSSYRARVERWFGQSFDKPVRRMREYVEVIRRILTEGETTYEGDVFRTRDYPDVTALTHAPRNIRVFLGVTGPMMRKLAGRVADGVILNSLSTPEFIRRSLELIEEGAVKAERDPSDVEIGCSIVLSANEDRAEAIEAAKRGLMFYIIYPEFDPIVETTQFLPQIQELRDAYWGGDESAAYDVITEELLEAFVVFGTPEECREKLGQYVDAGVELLVIRSCVDRLNGKEAVLQNIEALKDYTSTAATTT